MCNQDILLEDLCPIKDIIPSFYEQFKGTQILEICFECTELTIAYHPTDTRRSAYVDPLIRGLDLDTRNVRIPQWMFLHDYDRSLPDEFNTLFEVIEWLAEHPKRKYIKRIWSTIKITALYRYISSRQRAFVHNLLRTVEKDRYYKYENKYY